uniref:Uncharacterized protein n=1 Tax=Strigamia maritima TaxID=126957 RepID=T1IL38_STRMM
MLLRLLEINDQTYDSRRLARSRHNLFSSPRRSKHSHSHSRSSRRSHYPTFSSAQVLESLQLELGDRSLTPTIGSSRDVTPSPHRPKASASSTLQSIAKSISHTKK